MGLLRRIRNPELLQTGLRRRGCFEGWYFKLIDRPMTGSAAVIPGVSLGGRGCVEGSHAFVQVIHGGRGRYFRYPLSAFDADRREFRVGVGGSSFSCRGMLLDLDGPDGRIAGELRFYDGLPFPKTVLWPGIMGPYSFVPGMECYHGIVSIRHGISGSLIIDGETLCFDGGSGYVEKDWGRSFPSCWIWLQANHFGRDAAFLFSVADIPFLGSSFHGFFAFLYLDGRLHRFATYTGARLVSLTERNGETAVAIQGRGMTLEVTARPGPGGLLKAPKNGLMDRMIEETIQAAVEVRLTGSKGVLFHGQSPCAGMERYRSEALLTGR